MISNRSLFSKFFNKNNEVTDENTSNKSVLQQDILLVTAKCIITIAPAIKLFRVIKDMPQRARHSAR